MVNSTHPTLQMGRDETNDIVIVSLFASRLHARVQARDGQFVLTDLSSNGTFVRVDEQAGEESVEDLLGGFPHLERHGVVLLGIVECHDPDTAFLAGQHLRHVDRKILQADPVIGKGMTGVLEVLAGLQQRLAGNATHVGAGAAGCRATVSIYPLVYASDLETDLCSANGRDVATRACADDDDVKCFAHGNFSFKGKDLFRDTVLFKLNVKQ
jgi:hypothetical protein